MRITRYTRRSPFLSPWRELEHMSHRFNRLFGEPDSGEADAGEVVSPADIEAIANKINEMYGRFRRGELVSRVKLSEIDKYERRKQTGELAAILDDQR